VTTSRMVACDSARFTFRIQHLCVNRRLRRGGGANRRLLWAPTADAVERSKGDVEVGAHVSPAPALPQEQVAQEHALLHDVQTQRLLGHAGRKVVADLVQRLGKLWQGPNHESLHVHALRALKYKCSCSQTPLREQNRIYPPSLESCFAKTPCSRFFAVKHLPVDFLYAQIPWPDYTTKPLATCVFDAKGFMLGKPSPAQRGEKNTEPFALSWCVGW
jgi:hypothetical protein